MEDLNICDNNDDGDDTNGLIQDIDLNSLIPSILGTTQDEDDFTVSFHEELIDAQMGTSPLSTPYANTTADLQTIYVRIVNNDTGCVNDDLSFDLVICMFDLFIASIQTNNYFFISVFFIKLHKF